MTKRGEKMIKIVKETDNEGETQKKKHRLENIYKMTRGQTFIM